MTREGTIALAEEKETERSPFDLGRLGDVLSHQGLAEYVGCFDPFALRRSDWERNRRQAPDRLRPLIDLFLLNRTVVPAVLPGVLQDQLANLEAIGLLRRFASGVAMVGGLSVLPVFGRWLMCEAPQANPHFYFGDDTLSLLARLMPKAGGRCLDLCAGPGMLALYAAGVADQVVAVELTPAPAHLARLNVDLNRMSHRIEVREGDLYAPINASEDFDTVVANPPMLLIPDAFDGPVIGRGGEDGLDLTRRILDGLPQVLRPGGSAQIIGVSLSNGRTPLGLGGIEDVVAGSLDLTFSILSHRPVGEDAAYLDALVATVVATSGAADGEVRAAYLAMFRKAGASALCHFFIHARAGRGQIDVIDASASNSAAGWRWSGQSR